MFDALSGQDVFTVELHVRRGRGRGKNRNVLTFECSPRVSPCVKKEMLDVLPKTVVAGLPVGKYTFEQCSLTGFQVKDYPSAANPGQLREIGSALFPVVRRCHSRLVSLLDTVTNEEAIDEAVDGMYRTAIILVAEDRKFANLRPGFLKVEIGLDVSVFDVYFKMGIEPDSLEGTDAFDYLVVRFEETQFLGVLCVCQENHPFAEYALALFSSLFNERIAAREQPAVREAQRCIERQIADGQADRASLLGTFGELGADERLDIEGWATRFVTSGATVPDA